jgi:hypothetical protein
MLSNATRNCRKTALLFFLFYSLFSSSAFAQGTWTAVTNHPASSNAGVMLLLNDGTVLCKNSSGGGNGTGWSRLTPVNGSYINGTWSTIASMAKDRLYFSTQVLPDGRVYACGGEYGAGGNNGEVWNPVTNTWTTTGGAGWTFAYNISDANSEILPDGTVLQAYVDEPHTDSNWIWHPSTNTYTRTGNCVRWNNEAVWVKLPDTSIVFFDNYSTTSERYEFKTATFINDGVGTENTFDAYGSEEGPGFLLPNGQVFFMGSSNVTQYYTPTGTTAPGTFTSGPTPIAGSGAPDAPGAMMPNGHILYALSPAPYAATTAGEFPTPTTFYEFDYTTNTFTTLTAPGGGASLANATYIYNMLVLPDGSVLFSSQGSKNYYVYKPTAGPIAAGQPTIATITRENCDTFQVTGTLFNGISEGAAYGDDWQMSSNYPIVRLSNGTNTYYATTYNWNRIGAVMTGALPDTCIFVTPAAMPAGTYSVTLVANGNPSAPFTLNTSLAIFPASLVLCQGGTATLTDAQTIGSWSSANTGIATIGSSTGVVTGVGVGTTTLSYSIGQCFSTIIVTVNIGSGAISGNLSVCQGSVTALSNATAGGTWSSSNGNATVDGSGSVTGVTAGTSTISYAPPAGCIATAIVTVNALPTATITPAEPTEFCTGGSVVLNASAGVTYQWQLGGGNIGGATLSSYTATGAGNYAVIVTNVNGCSATSATITVTVDMPPAATITAAGSTTFCTGGSVVLNANTGAGYSYQWQLGGGNIAGATTSSYTAALAGDYTVIVYSGACNTASAVTTVTITAGPGATITPAGPTTFCPGGSVELDANTGAGITYQWLLGGTNIPGATNFNYIATAAGNYAVIVSSGACVVTSATTTVNVLSLPTVTPISGTANICVLQITPLTDATGAGAWSSSDATIASVDATGNVTGITGGTAIISYTETNTCGSVSATYDITVNALPIVASISGVTTICIGQISPLSDITASGVWNSGTPAIATISAGGLLTGVSAGVDNISYTVTNAAGCVSSAITAVNITTPFTSTITPASSTTFCTGGYVGLNATVGTGYTYQWEIGGVNIIGATSASYIASTSGVYNVIVTDPSGCPSNASGITVSVNPSPIVVPTVNISASLGTVLCATTSAETFTAVPTNGGVGPTYQWYVNGTTTGTGATYSYTPASGDIVKVVMISDDICAFPDSAANSITMTISPLETPSVSIVMVPNHGDSTCVGDTVEYEAIPVYGGTAPTYRWTKNNINVATGPYFIDHEAHDNDTLYVTLQSNYPCLAVDTAVSTMFVLHIFPQTVNALSVSVSQSTIGSGAVDTFTAIATGAGATPLFQWYINGNPVAGANTSVYITDSLRQGEIVNCAETSSFLCSEPPFILSGGITVSVVASGVQQVGNNTGNFTLVPNPNSGQFTVKGNVAGADSKVFIQVTNVLGQSVYKKTVQANNGAINEQITLDKSVAAGTYQVSVTSGEDNVVFHVVVEK